MNEQRCAPIIIAVDYEPLRARLEAEIRAKGIEPVIVDDSTAVWEVPPPVLDEGVAVLETNDDVARLVQTANDLYWSPFQRVGAAGTICVVSQEAREQNPSLGRSLIDGDAAVLAVRLRDLTGSEVVSMARRLEQRVEKVPVENWADRLDPVFDRLRDRANDAEAWMDAYDLVMARDGIHIVRYEVGAGLARQAVQLSPEDDTAWTKLAQALFYSDRDEETAEAARRAISINPEGAQAHRLLGEALDRLGNRDGARTEMEKALSLIGDDEGLKRLVIANLKEYDPDSKSSKWLARLKASRGKNEGDKQS